MATATKEVTETKRTTRKPLGQTNGQATSSEYVIPLADEQDTTLVALKIELATIDEMIRHQLSELAFAELLHRRKVIYEILHPET